MLVILYMATLGSHKPRIQGLILVTLYMATLGSHKPRIQGLILATLCMATLRQARAQGDTLVALHFQGVYLHCVLFRAIHADLFAIDDTVAPDRCGQYLYSPELY